MNWKNLAKTIAMLFGMCLSYACVFSFLVLLLTYIPKQYWGVVVAVIAILFIILLGVGVYKDMNKKEKT